MTPPYAGTHTESRFAREIQQESSNNVALHFRASAPSAPTKSIAYVTRPRTKCRRWVKMDVWEVAPPVHILAVDNLRLLRMQHQLAGRKAVGNCTPEYPRLLGALAVTDDVVRVPLEWDARKRPRHPRIERVMQEQVRQQGRDHPPPAAFPPCAARRYRPPSALAPLTSARCRA